MANKKGILISVFAVMTVLATGGALIFLVPLPEERAIKELSKIRLASYTVSDATVKQALAELNVQLQETSRTRYRFSLAPDVPDDSRLSLDLQDVPPTECARYIGEFSFMRMFGTDEGVVLDSYHTGTQYYKPSWRRNARYWLKHELPWLWDRWLHQSSPDPFAPASGP